MTCDCPSDDVLKWCQHKTCSIIHLIHHPEKIIKYSELKKSCEGFTHKQLVTLVLNKCFEDSKFLKQVIETKMDQLEEHAFIEKKVVVQNFETIDTSVFIKELEEINIIYERGFISPQIKFEKTTNTLQNILNTIHSMWQQKYYKNALLLLQRITDYLYQEDGYRTLVTSIGKIWLKYVTDEDVPITIKKEFKDPLDKWSSKFTEPGMKFKAASILIISDWNEEYLKSIMNGDLEVKCNEESSTLLSRAVILKAKMKDYSQIVNYVFLKELSSLNRERLKQLAIELESLNPSLATLVYIRLFDFGDFNIQGLKFILNINQNTKAERNKPIQNLTVLCCIETAKELLKIRDWKQISRVFINFPEEIQNLLTLYMTAFNNYEYNLFYNFSEFTQRIFEAEELDLLYYFLLNTKYQIESHNYKILVDYILEKGEFAVTAFVEKLLESRPRILFRDIGILLFSSNYPMHAFKLYLKLLTSFDEGFIAISDFIEVCDKLGEEESSKMIESSKDNFLLPNVLIFEKNLCSDRYLNIRITILETVLSKYTPDYNSLSQSKKDYLSIIYPDLLYKLYNLKYQNNYQKVYEELLNKIQIFETLIRYAKEAKLKNLNEIVLKYIKKAVATHIGILKKTEILIDFKELLTKTDLLDLGDKIMNEEPTIETYKILTELDPSYKNKIDQYVKSDNITEKTIPLIIESKKFEKIFDGYDKTNSRGLYITTLLKECINSKIESTFILNKFKTIIKNTILQCYEDIQFRLNNSNQIDTIIQEILDNESYGKDLGLFLLQCKTETLARFVSSSSAASYRLFVDWLSIVSNYFGKHKMENLFKEYVNEICTWKQIKSKTKLVKMIKDKFEK